MNSVSFLVPGCDISLELQLNVERKRFDISSIMDQMYLDFAISS